MFIYIGGYLNNGFKEIKMIKIIKKELLEDANNYYGKRIPTDTILQNYIAIELIKRLDFGSEEGTRGSVAYCFY